MLFGGNFMILDINLNPCRDDPMDVSLDSVMGSHVDFAFGDDRKSFAGFHRFEVTREIDEADGEERVSRATHPPMNGPPHHLLMLSTKCMH
jgi:hypothetical protein